MGTFTVHLSQSYKKTKLAFIEKLRKLAIWMTFGPKRDKLSSKAAMVRNVADMFETRLTSSSDNLDLSLAQELERIKKKTDDIAQMSIIKELVTNLEVKNEEQEIASIKDALHLFLKSEKLAETSGQSARESIRDPSIHQPKVVEQNSLRDLLKPQSGGAHPKGIQETGGGIFAQAVSMRDQTRVANEMNIVVMPKYEDENGSPNFFKETTPPSSSLYVALGYDTKARSGVKHYRKFLDKPLEETDFMSDFSSASLPIHIGKRIVTENKSWLKSIFMKDDPYKVVGNFNGSFELIEEDLLQMIENLDIDRKYLEMFYLPASVDDWRHTKADRNVLSEHKVMVRLYIIDAEISEDTDIGSDPDPYLKISLGKTKIDVLSSYRDFEGLHREQQVAKVLPDVPVAYA